MLLLEAVDAVRSFLETGGTVLLLIAGVTFWMWTLILERIWYFSRGFRTDMERVRAAWAERGEQRSWYAQQHRRLLISEVSQQLKQSIPMIKTLVALCPLLGLLGTVSGMIEVFDVMAIAGGGNARAMASGVAKATIPTMAGMVAALSGLYFSVRLERNAREQTERVADSLIHA